MSVALGTMPLRLSEGTYKWPLLLLSLALVCVAMMIRSLKVHQTAGQGHLTKCYPVSGEPTRTLKSRFASGNKLLWTVLKRD
jgi:hypothetical protein